MNIAFTTLLVLIALFPGFFFQSSYHHNPASKKYARSSVFNNFAGAIIPALLIHATLITIINSKEEGTIVSFQAIGSLLIGKGEVDLATVFEQSVGNYYGAIVSYILLSVIVGSSFGFLGSYIIRRWNWDSRVSILRFDNMWYYVFNGEIQGWPESKRGKKKRLADLKAIRDGLYDVRMEILVEVDGGAYIYEGRAGTYFLNKDGLDRVYLDDCSRRPFPTSNTKHQNFEAGKKDSDEIVILGNDIVIFRDTIVNINFKYDGDPERFENMAQATKGIADMTIPQESLVSHPDKEKNSKAKEEPKEGGE